jgi:hypothetical protein
MGGWGVETEEVKAGQWVVTRHSADQFIASPVNIQYFY